MDAIILINDGQHRKFAIDQALRLTKDKTLCDETIPVVIYYDEGLSRSKQIFSDINANLVKPSAAISALYDLRNPYNKYVLETLGRHAEISRYVDKEATTIGVKSEMIWPLVHYKKFFLQLTGLKEKCFDHESLHRKFGSLVNEFPDSVLAAMVEMVQPLKLALSGDLSSEDLRIEYVAGHAVYLESLALALNGLAMNVSSVSREQVFTAVAKIATLSTERSSAHWIGRCVLADRMVKTADSVKLTAALMRRAADIPLSEAMIEAETRHGF
jgi:DNA sulfur modification protein DndB